MQEYKYYLGGEFKSSSEKIEVIDPATEEAFAYIYQASKEDLEIALSQAKKAQKEWKNFSFKERAKVLRDIAKVILDNLSSLAELETKEIGKTYKESLFVDIPLSAEVFDYYASFLESLSEDLIKTDTGIDLIKYEPYGVCGVYLPYNVPLMIFGFSCAGALASGNALIVKPSEYGSLSLSELAKHLDKLDMPKGLINIITGRGETVGKYLAQAEVDLISFTGSLQTLKKIVSYSADNPKKIICELGGVNFTVIFSDADKERTIDSLLSSSFMKQGQMCIGTSIALIEESIYESFISEFLEKVKKIKIGSPFEPTTGLGPLVSREHLSAVDKKVKEIISQGNKLLWGGEILKGKGYFYSPTVIELKELVYEEFFSPVVLVKRFKQEELPSILENNPTGLVLQIWSSNLEKAKRLAESYSWGTVWINTFAQMSAHTSFGGVKKSGWGRNLGKWGFFEYTQPKHIGIGFKKGPAEGWFGV